MLYFCFNFEREGALLGVRSTIVLGVTRIKILTGIHVWNVRKQYLLDLKGLAVQIILE